MGYMTRAMWGFTDASERGTKSEVAHKWAEWLHNPSRVGIPQHFRVRDKIRNARHMGGLDMSPLPSAVPTLQSGGQNQNWTTRGRIGYVTCAA